MAGKRCITVSFKNTKKDTALFDLLIEMEDRSSEIKKILNDYYFTTKKESQIAHKRIEEKEEVNILDF